MKINKKEVMQKAWEIAREGVEKFGGKVKEYFAKALKIAWAIVKKEENQMDKVNGYEITERNYTVKGWQKYGHKRVYFEGYFVFNDIVKGNKVGVRVNFKGYFDAKKGKAVYQKAPARYEDFIKAVLRDEVNAVVVSMNNSNNNDNEGERDFGMIYEGY